MLIYTEIDGITVAVQKVKRKNGTEYWRLAPNFWKPSEEQKAVRDTLSRAAYNQKERDGYTTRERVDSAVQKDFQGWIKSEPEQRETKLMQRVKEIKKLGKIGTGVIAVGRPEEAEVRQTNA